MFVEKQEVIKIKIAIIADIHGNPVALKEILRDAKENNVDEIIYLGDLVNDFPFGNLSAYRKLCFLVVCFYATCIFPLVSKSMVGNLFKKLPYC